MSDMIAPPNQNDPRSGLADWLELQALSSPRGISSGSTLLNIIDVLGDDAAFPLPADQETGEPLDESILGERESQLVDIAFEELEYRNSVLGASYPFEVEMSRSRLSLKQSVISSHPGQIVYIFCLLASATRESRLRLGKELKDRIGNTFQVCACLAAGGYLRGEVSSFGFPRRTGTDFLPALRETYQRFGVGTIHNQGNIPEGLPDSLKDGGIDIIAWLDHPDKMPGKLYLLGQCASGANWRSKSVLEYIEQLHGSWFVSQPAKHHSPAMFIPFLTHYDLDEPRNVPFLEKLKNAIQHEERRFGMIFDLLRIAHFSDICMRFDPQMREKIDGTDRLDEVKAWVKTTCDNAGMAILV